MTSARVPPRRTTPRYQAVQISAPVRGREWRDLGLLYHWIRGHGQHVIPAHSPRVTLAQGDVRHLRYRVHPPGRAIARVWQLVLRPETLSASPPRLEVTYPDSTVLVYELTEPFERVLGPGIPSVTYVEPLAAKSGAEQELSLRIEHVGAADAVDAWIESVSCVELPRAVLSESSPDLGVDLETLRAGQPGYDDGASNRRSITALAENLASTSLPRSLVQLAFPRVSHAGATTDLFTLPIPIVPSKIGRSDTGRTLHWDVYARTDDNKTTGQIRLLTSGAGDTSTATVDGAVSTAFAWLDPPDIDALCEDLSTADGSGGETVQVEIERTAGTGAIQIESISIWET